MKNYALDQLDEIEERIQRYTHEKPKPQPLFFQGLVTGMLLSIPLWMIVWWLI